MLMLTTDRQTDRQMENTIALFPPCRAGLAGRVGTVECVQLEEEEEEEEIYLTQRRYNHGNSIQIVQSQVARKPEGQQCWPPIEHTNC